MFFFDIKEELSLICHILCCSHAYECVNIYATSVNVLAYRRRRAHGEGRKEITMTHFRFCFSVSPPSDVSTERHSEKKKRYLIKCPLSSTVFYINQKIPVQRVNAASCRAEQQQRRSEAIWLEIIVAWNKTEIEKKKVAAFIVLRQSFKLIFNQTSQPNVLPSHSRSICVWKDISY